MYTFLIFFNFFHFFHFLKKKYNFSPFYHFSQFFTCFSFFAIFRHLSINFLHFFTINLYFDFDSSNLHAKRCSWLYWPNGNSNWMGALEIWRRSSIRFARSSSNCLFLHQTFEQNPAFHDHVFCCCFFLCFFICLGANYRKQCMPGNVPHSWT